MSTEPQHRILGITLIELMIVVVVIAILGVIAMPSYRQYTIRAHRTEAKSALLRLQVNQERWYLQHNTYTDDPEVLGFADSLSENGVYALSIVAHSDGLAHGYAAVARPNPAGGTHGVRMTDDTECTEFRLSSEGVKSASPDPAGRCW